MAASLFAAPDIRNVCPFSKPFVRAEPLVFTNHWHSFTFAPWEKKLKVVNEKVREVGR
jgi:hypothetical protein